MIQTAKDFADAAKEVISDDEKLLLNIGFKNA